MIRLQNLSMHYTLGDSRIDILREVSLNIAAGELEIRTRAPLPEAMLEWMQGKLGTLATLRAIGLRDGRLAARRLAGHHWLVGRFALRMAVTGLYRADSPLRPTLLSLGSALTLLVASTLVVLALLHTNEETVPARAPALVFYDLPAAQNFMPI